jgi:PKD repeat protein
MELSGTYGNDIIGYPTTPGVYNVTISVSNDYGSDTETLIYTIPDPHSPPIIAGALTATGSVGRSYG